MARLGNPNWKPGVSGNPGGRREQKFRNALDRAIAQDDGHRLRMAAEKLLDMASEGIAWAIGMLADRVDGKADQNINLVHRAEEMSDDDLLRIAAASSNRAASEKSSEENLTKVH